MANRPTILWFRQDFRLADNSAVAAALSAEESIVPVYIWAEADYGDWVPGGASKWWLHRALEAMVDSLEGLGGGLVLRVGDSLEVLQALVEETGAKRVVWNRRYESPARERDAEIKRALRESGIEVESFNSSLLNEPHTVSTGGGLPYKVYTPYWKKVSERTVEAPVQVDLAKLRFHDPLPKSVPLEELALLPDHDWPEKLESRWEVGEAAAHQRLDTFLNGGVSTYAGDRDVPSLDGTSSLSPYLHWGHIGPRQVVDAVSKSVDPDEEGPSVFLKEIYWREFAYNVLYHFPHTPDTPLQSKYADFPWEDDSRLLAAWQRGRTGYPIVDAGMRQLYETGWMHNRVRMIVSSLLVKHLLQDWRAGAAWFWDTLVDADLASNTLGWQWSGGCGADAAPYFRIFNPITQGKKFDPGGDYVRRYVPELDKLPAKFIHEPWEAPESVLKDAGVVLGDHYPAPVIEHKQGRERALAAFDKVKGQACG